MGKTVVKLAAFERVLGSVRGSVAPSILALALGACAEGVAGGAFNFEVPITREAAVALARLRQVSVEVSLSSQRLGGEPIDVGRIPAGVRREGREGRLVTPLSFDSIARAGGLRGDGNVRGERGILPSPARRQEVTPTSDTIPGALGPEGDAVSESELASFWLDLGALVLSGDLRVLKVSAQIEIAPGSGEAGGFGVSVDPGLISIEYIDVDKDGESNMVEQYVGSDPQNAYIEPAPDQLVTAEAFLDSTFDALPGTEPLDVSGDAPAPVAEEATFVSAEPVPVVTDTATQLPEEDLALMTAPTPVAVPTDVTPPPPPSITRTLPASPSSSLYPAVEGVAEAGSTVWLSNSGVLVGSTMADTNGTFILAPGSPLTSNGASALVVWATDAAGNVSSSSYPITYVHDDLPPSAGVVNDGAGADVDSSTSTSSIAANWSGFYDPTGIGRYEYSIGTSRSCGGDVLAPVNVGWQQSQVTNALALRTGITYYNCVRAADGAGNVGIWQASDGFSIPVSTRRSPKAPKTGEGR